MQIFSYNPNGYSGGLVHIEVDIRRGLPNIDIVGLAGGAVRESRERVRAAIGNSGFEFPNGHIVICLSPADVPKVGSAFDLAIALALLMAGSGLKDDPGGAILVMGELTLGGKVRPVEAIIPALLEAIQSGIEHFLLPTENQAEAQLVLAKGSVFATDLVEAMTKLAGKSHETITTNNVGTNKLATRGQSRLSHGLPNSHEVFNIQVFRDEPLLFLGLLAAAAGRHHVLIYGPPGAGKTMALRFLGSLLPELSQSELLEVNRLHSLAGRIDARTGLVNRAPVRMPHHGSSPEALLGGGRYGKPGELSLAHKGLLILDEAAEFRKSVLQALREPMEDGQVRLGRVDGMVRFPADFILGMSLNPCPCGKFGSGQGVCCCTSQAVLNYWAKIGAPVIDRTDIRICLGIKFEPARTEPVLETQRYRELPVFSLLDDVAGMRARIQAVAALAKPANASLRGVHVDENCRLTHAAQAIFHDTVCQSGMLGRSRHGVLRLAKTIAELCEYDQINELVLEAALRLRTSISPVEGLSLFQ